MCEPTTWVMAATAVAGAVQSNRQRQQAKRANQQQMTAQEQAERNRQIQALEDRMEEFRRQNQVHQGTTQIDNLFSAFGLQPLAPEEGFNLLDLPDRLDPDDPRTQQLLDGASFQDVFGGGSTLDLRDRQRDQGFFDQRRQAFLDFANPQFDRQFDQERDNLTFALTRAGLNQSSPAAQRAQQLGQQANQARQHIASTAQQHADQARQQTLDARSTLLGQLHATGDPQTALAGAGERLASLQSVPSFNPIGPMFEGVTQNIGGFQQGRRRGQAGIPLSGFFNQGSPFGAGSSRVVGG